MNGSDERSAQAPATSDVLLSLDVIPATTKGTRLPPFKLSPAMTAWASEHAPGIDVRRETEAFADYWRAKPGKDGLKLDWMATWRNWLRRAKPSPGTPNGHRVSNRDATAAALGLGDDFGSTWSPDLQERLLGRSTRTVIDVADQQELTR